MKRSKIKQKPTHRLTFGQVPSRNKQLGSASALLILAFVMALSLASPVYGSDQEPSHSDLAQVLTNLQKPDPKVVSENAKKLSGYPYNEAEAALLGLIQNQIARGSEGLNTFILSAAVEGLNGIGTSASVDSLSQARAQLNALQVGARFNQRSKDVIVQNMQAALGLMQDRRNALPSGIKIEIPKHSPIQQADGVRFLEIDGAKHEFAGDKIRVLARNGDDAAKAVALSAIEFLTDSVLENIAEKDEFKIFGRDSEAKDALLTLVRIKGKNPVLVGPAGVGKTTIAQRLAQIISMELPNDPLYDELRGASIIETTPARISRLAKSDANSAQASAVEEFFDGVLQMETKIGHPIIVFIDEVHTLSEAQIEAMKPYLDSRKRAIKFVGATTGREFNMTFKQNEAIKRRLQLIDVKEFSIEQTIEIVKQTWEGQVERRYGVKFSEDAVKSIVQNARTLLPDNGRFDGAIKIMQDIAISEKDARPNSGTLALGEPQVNSFLQKRLGYPVNAKDGRAMQEYREALTKNLESDVLFQHTMTESTVDLWMELMGDHERGVRVQALLGPTGTGKSELGRSLAKRVFNRDGAFLEIDANTYKTGGMALNSLVGAPNGVISSDKTSGVLMDYLDDPSKGKFGGVILINEAERMPQEAWERLMEMLDTGEVAGGDGKVRKLTRHLIILTSNRVDKTVFPAGIERLSDQEMDSHINSYGNDKLRETYKQKSSGKDEFVLPDAIIARVDRWSLAKPITLAMAKVIAGKVAEKAVVRIGERFGVKITVDQTAVDTITERSFQSGMGARPVIKAAQGYLQKIITQSVSKIGNHPDQTVSVTAESGQLVASLSNGEKVSLSLPKPQNVDPLDDPAFAQKMKNLLPSLRETVIGQDDATKAIAQAVIAHQSDPASAKRPTALFLVGSTGTGKTSTAKALAKALYNNSDRAEVIDLGKVNFEGALNDIFGSKKGYVGSQDRAQFEEILLRNPEGGVIVFDEASNMGGEDKARKNAMFKQGFYSLLEEGKWTSSSTGTTYDLSKYVFIFTGNDGEKLFEGIDADDLRLATYKQNKDRSKVQKLLIQAGVPEAFLGRMIDVILMKPLLSSDIKQITEGMLRETLKSYQERGLKFEISQDFYVKVAKAFYSHDQGARSIRSMLDSGFKATLANLIVQGGGLQVFKGQTIRVDLIDTLKARPYITKASERNVALTIQARSAKGVITETITGDLTTKAVTVNKQSFTDARATAIHEAGHAVANKVELTGQRLAHLTINGTGNAAGYARYDDVHVKSKAFTRESLVARVAMMLAGSRAQQMDGQPVDAGWASDRQKALELISRSILEFGLVPELQSVLVREGKPHLTARQTQIASSAVDKIFQEGDALAQEMLTANWQLVRDVSAQLLKKGSISGEDFYALEVAQKNRPIAARASRLKAAPAAGPSASHLKCESLFLGGGR